MTAARTVPEIIAAVEAAAELPDGALVDMKRRTHDVSLARHVACYVAKRETHLSFKKIAMAFGSNDHKLILWGFNHIAIHVAKHDDAVVALINEVAPNLGVR